MILRLLNVPNQRWNFNQLPLGNAASTFITARKVFLLDFSLSGIFILFFTGCFLYLSPFIFFTSSLFPFSFSSDIFSFLHLLFSLFQHPYNLFLCLSFFPVHYFHHFLPSHTCSFLFVFLRFLVLMGIHCLFIFNFSHFIIFISSLCATCSLFILAVFFFFCSQFYREL